MLKTETPSSAPFNSEIKESFLDLSRDAGMRCWGLGFGFRTLETGGEIVLLHEKIRISLTQTELKFMECLYRDPGEFVTYATIKREIRQVDPNADFAQTLYNISKKTFEASKIILPVEISDDGIRLSGGLRDNQS